MRSFVAASRQPLGAVHRYFEVSLYLLISTSAVTLVSTGKLDLVSTLVPPAALLAKGIRYWRGRGPELSARAATWLVIAYFLFFPLDLWFFSRGLAAGAPNPGLYAALLAAIHLMLFAMVVRLFSARTTRDYLFLAMLAFAMMLVAAILTVDTTFLVAFLVFLVLAVSTFIGLEIRRSAEGSVAPPLEIGTPAAARLHKALGLTSTAVAFSALVLGLVIFFLIPRFTAGYLSGLNLQPSLISGFSDNVELGQIGQIKKSTAVVMRVRVRGGSGRLQNVKWRGIALTTFDGKRWFTEEHAAVAITSAPDGWCRVGALQPQLRLNSYPLEYTVLLEPLATDTLFVAAKAIALRGHFWAGSERLGHPARRSYLLLDKTESLFNPFHNFAKIRYEGRSYVPAARPEQLRAASIDYPGEIGEVYLQLPQLDPRIAQLAQEVTARARTPYEKAAAIELYLRTRFGYTLDLSSPPTAHPLAHFLFERRAGHCEYFAAAMTVMLRTLGIPARYVNGFLPGEYNDVGDDFIVRASDAHSWVEVYFPDYGWFPFDPTPPSDERAKGWLGRLALYWDWFELVWSEWVINYDFIHQVTLAQNLQRASREWSERFRNYVQQKRRETVDLLKRWQQRAAVLPPAVPGALVVLLALLLLVRRRTIRDYLAAQWGLRAARRGGLTPRLATLHYQRLLRLLARRGLHKMPAQTPLEFVASVPLPELAVPVAKFTELYQSARFGAEQADARQMSGLLGSIQTLLRSRPRFK